MNVQPSVFSLVENAWRDKETEGDSHDEVDGFSIGTLRQGPTSEGIADVDGEGKFFGEVLNRNWDRGTHFVSLLTGYGT